VWFSFSFSFLFNSKSFSNLFESIWVFESKPLNTLNHVH
jgi:hypothetical protein